MIRPGRNLALELVRVTEAAALGAARWMGRGNKEAGDQAAVDAMRRIIGVVEMDGIVVIGEGEKDHAPMLYNGEHLGTGSPPEVDIAVDPIDGTRLLANGQPNALAVVALAERDAMWKPGPAFYMEKIVVGPRARGAIDISAPVENNLRSVAKALDKQLPDLTLVVLDRPRNAYIIRVARALGVRIRLIGDGDVAGAIATATPGSSVDMLMGIGGTPEGVIAACALRCMGGDMQARLAPQSDKERERVLAAGLDPYQVLTIADLVKGDNVFFAATGITGGEMLEGVRYTPDGIITSSMVMRSRSGTIRFIRAIHQPEKLNEISPISQ